MDTSEFALLVLGKLMYELIHTKYTFMGNTERRLPSLNLGYEDQVFFRYPGFYKNILRIMLLSYYELKVVTEYRKDEYFMVIFAINALILLPLLYLKLEAITSLGDEYFHGVRPFKYDPTKLNIPPNAWDL